MKSFLHITLIIASLTLGMASCSRQVYKHAQTNGMHPSMYATLYQQSAAEYQALCFQAYQLAERRLQEQLSEKYEKPLAVVVDIDETVLDNIPYQASAIKNGFSYPVKWDEWINLASAEPVPGSKEFLTFAANSGVEVFYVTNRKEIFRDATLKNLIDQGFPYADDAHLFMRTNEHAKENRRSKIRETHEIVLLAGDNLGDFDGIFETQDGQVRLNETLANKNNFGNKWIILPNAVYGNWMDVLPGYQQGLSTEALADSLLQGLKGF